VRLAEYKALRDESLRCSQIFSNAAWLAVTGYGATIGVGAAFLNKVGSNARTVDEKLLLPATLCFLCLEAIAISAIYLAELWKYIRIGAYIRTEIEPALFASPTLPMRWEAWITAHRTKEVYVFSLLLLQLPVVAVFGAWIIWTAAGWPSTQVSVGSVEEFVSWIFTGSYLTKTLYLVLAVDVLMLGWFYARLSMAERGRFERPLIDRPRPWERRGR